jgi:5-methyltetrahydrofolate--homocysteine methyltransferase
MIRFNDKQWDNVIGNYRKWWKGELGRPILPLIIHGADAGRPKPDVPSPQFENCGDFSISAEAVIDRVDYDLSCCEFYGDSFPCVRMAHFGPGIMAAFLGAKAEPVKETVWFHPVKQVPIKDLHFTYDENNIWLNRIKDLYRAGMKKWGGNVCMSMTDIGGGMDVLASFLTTEGLLYEVLDNPKEVKRLCNEITGLWLRYYRELAEIIKEQRVFSDWSSQLCEKPTYMLQCDFSYMIGIDTWKEFVHDDLAIISAAIEKAFYHLDGIGEIIHLDDLLSINSISGIQWVPGAGEPETRDWCDLFAKISKAGKKIQMGYGFNKYLDDALKVIRKPDDLMKMPIQYAMKDKETALKNLAKYGAV